MARTQTNRSTVSVIIPVWNRASFIGNAIESVISQDVGAKVFVFDDFSDDNTAEVAETLGVEVFRADQHVGQCFARNYWLPFLSSDYVKWLDSDDELLPGCLKRQMAFLDRASSLDFCWDDMLAVNWNSGASRVINSHRSSGAFVLSDAINSGAIVGKPVPQIGTMLFRTSSVFDTNLTWNENYRSGKADIKFIADAVAMGMTGEATGNLGLKYNAGTPLPVRGEPRYS